VCRPPVEAAEQYTDGTAEESVWVDVAGTFDTTRRRRFPKEATQDDGAWGAVYCTVHRRWQVYQDEDYARERWRISAVVARYATESAGSEEPGVQAALLRDVLGNPFRAVNFDPGWLTPPAAPLALAAYDERSLPEGTLDPQLLAVLADALEDAGCTDAAILGHLRGPGPHVRGCWALDLILGKS
jgi:hypothetical protein